jgi:sulfur relay protein TusB/DsrH
MASTLFLLLKAPNEYHSLDTIAAIGGEDHIGVVLFEDATYFPFYPEKKEEILSVADEVYLMRDDLEARGFLDRVGKGFQVIDYPLLVDLIMQGYEQTITL